MTYIMNWLSKAAIPGLIAIILIFGVVKKTPVFDTFIEGAKEGLYTTIKILPVIVGIMLGINVLNASGALDMIVSLLKPIASLFEFLNKFFPWPF